MEKPTYEEWLAKGRKYSSQPVRAVLVTSEGYNLDVLWSDMSDDGRWLGTLVGDYYSLPKDMIDAIPNPDNIGRYTISYSYDGEWQIFPPTEEN